MGWDMRAIPADIPPVRLPSRQLIARDLAFFLSATGIPAIGVDISIGGRRLNVAAGVRAAGSSLPLTSASRFRASCLIKMFGSLVILKLAQVGSIDIDAPIGGYLPELGRTRRSKGGMIRVRHLLTHTGGYRGLDILDSDTWAQWTWDRCVEFLRDTPQLFEPGKVFNEGHFDHAILWKILEKVTGRDAPQLIRAHVFDPLGIESGIAAKDLSLPDAHVCEHIFSPRDKAWKRVKDPGKTQSPLWDITLTVRDFTTIGEVLLRNALDDPRNMILAVDADKLFHPVLSLPRTFGAGLDVNWRPRAFSLGCAIFGAGQAGYLAVSEGQNCAIVMDPRRGICVSLALNAAAPRVRVAILNCLFARINGVTARPARDFLMPEPVCIDFDDFLRPFSPRQLGGRYTGCFGDDMVVRAAANRIDFALGQNVKLALVRSQDNRLGMQTRAPIPIGIFPDPGSEKPAVMFGMYAFKKMC